MKLLSPVVWREGMHLAPHHFQTQGRYFEDLQSFALSSLVFGAYGVAGMELDEEALRNGTVALVHARGVMPDGLPFHFPHDPPPEPLQVEELFSPTAQSHRVLLAIPRYRAAGPNCGEASGGPSETARDETPAPAGTPGELRFRTSRKPVRDLVTGQDEQPVPLARKNFRLLLDVEADVEAPAAGAGDRGGGGDEPGSAAPGHGTGPGGDGGGARGMVSLPLARVRRDGSGNFVYDREFVPPVLRIGASRALMELLTRLVEILESRARSLARERSGGLDPAGGHGPRELLGYWFSHAVNSGLSILRHHRSTRGGHPERVFADLSTLAGSLTTFSLSADASALPLYDHDDPGPGFRALEREIRACLETVIPTNVVRLPVAMGEDHFHTASIDDPRLLGPNAHWFLGLRSSARRDRIIEGVPRLVKICSAKHIERLVREAYPGLDLDHAPSLPSGASPRPGTEYFRLGRTEPCWRSIADTRRAGIYVPAAIPDPELEVLVVLESQSPSDS